MRNIIIIAAKEFKSFLMSPMFYVIISIFLALCGFIFGSSGLTYSETSINGFLQSGSLLMLLLIAVVTMRLMAEEKKLGTMEILITAPIKDSEIVLGKFFGSLGTILVMLLFTLYYPVLLMVFGDPDMGPIFSGYLGMILLCCASVAIGLFTSSITANQIVAAVAAGGILFGLWFLGGIATYLPKIFSDAVGYFSLSGYFADFMRGVIDTRAIVYFISITVLFLYMATRSLENSRWN